MAPTGPLPARGSGRHGLALIIAASAVALLVATGGTAVPQAIRALAGQGVSPDSVVLSSLLLNIALILFGWRHYRKLTAEVEKRRAAEAQALLQAQTDALTGYLNGPSFTRTVDHLLARTSETTQSVAVMVADLDNFKQINDSNGHAIGDELLRQTARRLKEVLPHTVTLARIGGDEFAFAMAFDPRGADAVGKTGAQIIAAICAPTLIEHRCIEVTASLGIAVCDTARNLPGSPADGAALIRKADLAMYYAKRQGRNCHFIFDSHMADEMRYRRELEADIREGIEKGQFIPYYEQQIDVQTGALTGFEMLARWHSPRLGLVKPDVFIPVAEEIGAIAALSEGLIRKALTDARSWHPSLTLSVNISPLQLRDPWFPQRLLKLLVEANFPPERIEIEITESCLHENIALVRTLVASLKNQGIKVSLDDFGTGYSSLAQLRNLPFDRIKIDRSFVSDVLRDPDKASIVEAMATLGKSLGLPVTAEGIETAEVHDHLRQFEAIKGQGYFYGQPQPASETRAWLQSRGLLNESAARPESGGPTECRPETDTSAAPQARRA